MDKFLVEGGYKLEGEVRISGSKNAALPILISALLADGESVFYNIPDLKDITNTILLLKNLGVFVDIKDNTVKINPLGLSSFEAPYDLVKRMRASILVLGPLIARMNKARVFLPGGCSIGKRPIDLHLKALKQFGVNIDFKEGYIDATSTGGLKGCSVHFNIPTVTGTENVIMVSVLAKGVTVLKNAACEPEIVDLSKVLIKMGAKISGAGSSKIVIEGVTLLRPVKYTIIPDRIEAGTFMLASTITRGDVNIINCMPEHLVSLISMLRLVGAVIDLDEHNMRVRGSNSFSKIDLRTLPYPGFPTDMQPLFMVLMSISKGVSTVYETIFENRFRHVSELNRMGANISISGDRAIIRGVESLFGAKVFANDLRGAASLVLAGLIAIGQTEIRGLEHLDRGYENIEKKIQRLGGSIKRIDA